MKRKYNGFIRLERDLWRSDEWCALTANARCLIIDIWARYNGKNNGGIRYSVMDASRCLHCSKRTAIRALNKLRDARLIEVVVKGSFEHKSGARKGAATEWRLTFLP